MKSKIKKKKFKSIFTNIKFYGFKYTIKKIIYRYLTLNSEIKNNTNLIDKDKKIFFDTINYDPILPNEIGIERMQKASIIIVDHPSTPVFEALFLNKPTILFWNKNINISNPYLKKILTELSKNKILFFSPKKAAFQLDSYLKNKNSIKRLWYKNKKIQILIKKIQAILLNNIKKRRKVTIIDQWKQFIKLEINS